MTGELQDMWLETTQSTLIPYGDGDRTGEKPVLDSQLLLNQTTCRHFPIVRLGLRLTLLPCRFSDLPGQICWEVMDMAVRQDISYEGLPVE